MFEEIKQCCVCGSDNLAHLYTFNYSDFDHRKPFCLKRCKKCGLVLNSPRLNLESIADLYEKDYYVFNNETEKKYCEEAKRDLGLILAVSKSGDRLLEIGCARGHLLKLAKESGYDVQGVEISTYASKIARSEEVPVFTGSIEQASFEEESFDIIVAFDVIEHVPDPLGFLKILRKYLKKEGSLILKTPNISSAFARLAGKRWDGFNPYHIYLFSPSTLRRLCVKAGFDIVKLVTEEVRLLSLDGVRRLGLGCLLGSTLRRKIGTWLRQRTFGATKTGENFLVANSGVLRMQEGLVGKWIRKRRLGDEILVYAKLTES